MIWKKSGRNLSKIWACPNHEKPGGCLEPYTSRLNMIDVADDACLHNPARLHEVRRRSRVNCADWHVSMSMPKLDQIEKYVSILEALGYETREPEEVHDGWIVKWRPRRESA
jgi:hypothetical protein